MFTVFTLTPISSEFSCIVQAFIDVCEPHCSRSRCMKRIFEQFISQRFPARSNSTSSVSAVSTEVQGVFKWVLILTICDFVFLCIQQSWEQNTHSNQQSEDICGLTTSKGLCEVFRFDFKVQVRTRVMGRLMS